MKQQPCFFCSKPLVPKRGGGFHFTLVVVNQGQSTVIAHKICASTYGKAAFYRKQDFTTTASRKPTLSQLDGEE